jgi:hypothetical protein
MKTNRLLIVIVVLQALTLAGQWLEGPKVLPVAQAQAFNSAADRQEMIDQMKSVNSKLDRLVSVLEGGNLQVKVVQPDERKDGAKSR